MRYIAALLLAQLANPRKPPTAEDIADILKAGNVEADKSRIQKLLSDVAGQNIQALINAGAVKMSAVGGGGGSTSVTEKVATSSGSANVVTEVPAASTGSSTGAGEKDSSEEGGGGDDFGGFFDD